MAKSDTGKKEEAKIEEPTTELWRKTSGKHHMSIGGVKKRFGPGCPDGDIVPFPIGMGPVGQTGWARVTPAVPLKPKNNLILQPIGSGGNWNVVNKETGKVINSKPLRLRAANALINGDVLVEEEK